VSQKETQACVRGIFTNALSGIRGNPQYSMRYELICWGKTRRNAIGSIWEKQIARGKP